MSFNTTRYELAAFPPTSLRYDYLESLAEPQEWFLEELIQSSQTWIIPSVAYGVISDQTLVEFFVAKRHSDQAPHLFDTLRQQTGFDKVLAKSFDHQLMELGTIGGVVPTKTAYLFRDFSPPSISAPVDVGLRQSTSDDLSEIWEMNDDFFDVFGELTHFDSTDNLWVLEKSGEILGCGTTTRVIKDMDAVDLGMLISPKHRRQGYGSYLISSLAKLVIASGQRPICGCAEHNLASRMTLQKAGFVSNHRLVNFDMA